MWWSVKFRENRLGQSAIEFVILVTAVLFFMIAFFVFIQDRIAATKYESTSVAVREVALTVQDEINLAASAQDGYSRQFTLPATINGFDYIASITDESVYVHTADGKHALALPVGSVSGDVVIGVNSITKVNGEIYLNN